MKISNDGILLIKKFEEYFEYNEMLPSCLSWKKRAANCTKIGTAAGWPHHSGYWYVRLFGKAYAVHRIVFAIHNGFLPKEIDHIDNDKANNAISNLRSATTSQNECNKPIQKNNTSGVKGVNWDKSTGMWKARIALNGTTKYIGRFHSINDASQAIKIARLEIHGDYARGNP